MKEVKAIIQPFMLDAVLHGLQTVDGLPAVTVSDAKGQSVIHPEKDARPKVKLEIMVSDELAGPVVDAIQEHAHTGNPGDGAIFVIDIARAVKIRTGETDADL